MNRALGRLIVTGLGSGCLPVAPGTWGSLVVCGLFLAAACGSGGRWYCVSGTMFVVGAAAGVACVALGRFAEAEFARKDPRRCVLDEWAGQAVALLLLPLGAGGRDWLTVAAVAFVAFRVFDIVKPPPARRAEKLDHGWGILLDDVVAGLYANAAGQLTLRLALGF